MIGTLLGTPGPPRRAADRHQGRAAAGHRPTPRRLPRAPAAHPGRLAAPARHRPRRPVAGARLRPGHPAGGDARRARPRGEPPGGSATSASPTSPAGRPRRPPPGRPPGPAGPRWSPPRWSTRCWSAASSARCCPPARRWASGVLPWSPLGRGVLTGKYRHGRRRTPGPPRRTSSGSSPATWSRAAPASSRRWRPRPAGSGVSPLEVALAWVRDRPGVVAPVLGARTVGQLLGALQVGADDPAGGDPRALDDVSAPPWATRNGRPDRWGPRVDLV